MKITSGNANAGSFCCAALIFIVIFSTVVYIWVQPLINDFIIDDEDAYEGGMYWVQNQYESHHSLTQVMNTIQFFPNESQADIIFRTGEKIEDSCDFPCVKMSGEQLNLVRIRYVHNKEH